ncbi:hypothetical protein DVH24_036688 [Malus domestica]|uniref:Uncharacterized protein n=1 Tax=Malus domestica TaxID=3750 RepID=A0A498IJT3_MALDO|nr:hypothetical protein DVH24_036688 [Malus domestica]
MQAVATLGTYDSIRDGKEGDMSRNLGLLIIFTSDPSRFDGERRFGVDTDGYYGGPCALSGDFGDKDGAPADFKPSFGVIFLLPVVSNILPFERLFCSVICSDPKLDSHRFNDILNEAITAGVGTSKSSLSGVAPLEAVIFDIDGTLCDSDPIHYYAFREMLPEIGFNGGVPITEEYYIENFTGKHNDDVARILFPDDFERGLKFTEDKEAMFRRLAVDKLKPVNGLYKVKKWIEDRTAFAYGQTSSGKTFTMNGSETDRVSTMVQVVGIIPSLHAATKISGSAQGIVTVASRWHALMTCSSNDSPHNRSSDSLVNFEAANRLSSLHTCYSESDLESTDYVHVPTNSQMASHMASYHKGQAFVLLVVDCGSYSISISL